MTPDEINIRKLNKEEAIRRLKGIYDIEYDPTYPVDVWEQLLMCEAVEEAQREYQEEIPHRINESVIVSENDSYKRKVKSELNWYKSEAIPKLKLCTSDTPRNEIAKLLEEIFKYWPPNKETHWLWVAQTYTARTLNWVMSATVKKYLRSGIRETPPAYFVYLLGFRKQRKEFRRKELRNTNDTR